MASNASVICKFSDGSYSYLRSVITLDQASEVKTDNSGILNIAGDLQLGQANQNKILTHAAAKIQTDSSADGCFGYAALYGLQGEIVVPIQGAGTLAGGLPALAKPVQMMTGMTVKVFAQARADAVQYASLAVVCRSGKTDIFQGLGVDNTAVSMTNVVGGKTIGEALVGEEIVQYYATYSASNGLADTGVSSGDGINALYAESSTGQLKGMFYTTTGGGAGQEQMVPYIPCSIIVQQNDSLTVTANV